MSHKQAKRDRVQARIAAGKETISQRQSQQPVIGKFSEGADPENVAAVLKESSNEAGMVMPNDSFIPATYQLTSHSGFLVENWKHGWKWISNIALTAIVAVNAAPIPAEVLNALPPHMQAKVSIGLGIIGVLGRFINQSRGKKAEVVNVDPA